jgi:phenylalanyl-tRNA synthetase beta subunit
MREDSPLAFSCSSLVSYLFSGIWQPSISIDKYVYSEKVAQVDAKWGDLVFSNTGNGSIRYESVAFLPGTKVPEGIDHVGVYVGEGKVTHISNATNKVVTELVATSKQFGEKVLYGRIADVDEMRFFVTIPHERLDIRIKEDLIEEVGRVMGLSAIKAVLPSLKRIGVPNKRLFYENKIKNILHAQGFSEIMTYSFGNTGEVSIVKGLASDKEKLRSTLSGGVLQAFQMNMLNSPLLGIDVVKMYEFGNVFTKDDERRQFALVIDDGKKKTSFTDEVDMILSEVKRTLGVKEVSYETVSAKPYCIVIDFDTLIEILPEPTTYEPLSQNDGIISYQAVSPYPFISRDIAMWTPSATTWEDIRALTSQISNPLVASVYLFDTFTKVFDEEGKKVEKTSYAFRLIFQSLERTLTDEEVNQMMIPYCEILQRQGFEIR